MIMITVILIEGYISPDKYITRITQTYREKVVEFVFIFEVRPHVSRLTTLFRKRLFGQPIRKRGIFFVVEVPQERSYTFHCNSCYPLINFFIIIMF